MNGENRCGEEIGETAHERIMQPTKMRAIPHLFSKDICQICLTGNMEDLQCLVLNPFANQIFTRLNMTSHFRCHIIRPFDAGIIVIVEDRW